MDDFIGSDRFFLIMGTIASTVFGVIPFAIGVYNLAKSQSSLRWRASVATIMSIDLESKTRTPKDDDGRERTTTTHEALVEYRYQWSGGNHTATRIRFGYQSTSAYKYHKKIYDKLKNAHEVNIWINPKKPEQATIVNGYSGGTKGILIPLFIGYCVLSMAFLMLGQNYQPPRYADISRSINIMLFITLVITAGLVIKNKSKKGIVESIQIESHHE